MIVPPCEMAMPDYPVPDGLVHVEGFASREEYCANVEAFKLSVLERVQGQPTDILVPLNGSLVALYHARVILENMGQLGNVNFIPVAKDERGWIVPDLDSTRQLVMIDDIADTGNTKTELEQVLGVEEHELSLLAMSRRVDTPEYTGNYSNAKAVPNRTNGSPPWVLNSYGMNSNKHFPSIDPGVLKAYERWSTEMLIAEEDDTFVPDATSYLQYLIKTQLFADGLSSAWMQAQVFIDNEADPVTRINYIVDFLNIV